MFFFNWATHFGWANKKEGRHFDCLSKACKVNVWVISFFHKVSKKLFHNTQVIICSWWRHNERQVCARNASFLQRRKGRRHQTVGCRQVHTDSNP